jgi:hypothetical protein
MTVDIEEFKNYLKIDKHGLDQELMEQPMLFFKISEAFAQATAERDMLKEQLASTDARLDSDMRRVFDKAGEKYTEAMVKNAVQTDKKHEAAIKKFFDAKEQADLFLALKEAFQSRAYMLRDLCSLYTANYFEESSARGSGQTNHATYRMGRERIATARSKRE